METNMQREETIKNIVQAMKWRLANDTHTPYPIDDETWRAMAEDVLAVVQTKLAEADNLSEVVRIYEKKLGVIEKDVSYIMALFSEMKEDIHDAFRWAQQQKNYLSEAKDDNGVKMLLEKLIAGEGWFPAENYHEDMGFALWKREPVEEPPYVGSPLCSDWDCDLDGETVFYGNEYYTHFQPLNAAELLVEEVKRLREDNAALKAALD
jgi:hypothetical protein